MNYDEVKSYLYSLTNYGNTYGLDRMHLLSQALGNPENNFPIIHVAGTNGKGSVCAMLEAIFRSNGYRTGLFTSPHLIHLEERIQINRQLIPKHEFIEYIQYIKNIIDNSTYENKALKPSFFEILNAVGFLYFAKNKIDIGIIETGIGGQFDSTNIINPLVSVITSISHDHTEILGENLQSIALAKAGIIKQKKPIVIGPLDIEIEKTIKQVAQAQNSPIFSVQDIFGKNINSYPLTSLQGSYQRKNAATALLVSQAIKNDFPTQDNLTHQALNNVDWPGRWQTIIIKQNKLILDCSHNEEGAKGLAENLKHLIQKENKNPTIILGVLGIYRAQSIIPVISQYAKNIILIKPNNPKALDTHILRALIPKDFHGQIIDGSIDSLVPLKEQLLVATGSIYLIGEIMEQLSKLS